MATEQTYYSDEKGVRITGTRVIFGSTTYSMANISSIRTDEEPAKRAPGIVTAIIGLILLVTGISAGWAWLIITGIVILGIGVLIARAASAKYHIKITSASGEATALSSNDKEYAGKIVNAVNEAIISRG